MDKYRKEQIEKAENKHDWNFNIKVKFYGTFENSNFLDIPYKDFIKIKEILINSELN